MNLNPQDLNIRLKVRNYETEQVKEIEIRTYSTIARFKTEVEKEFNIPAAEQVLAYSNMKLKDDDTFENLVKSHKLSSGDMIHLFSVRPIYVG